MATNRRVVAKARDGVALRLPLACVCLPQQMRTGERTIGDSYEVRAVLGELLQAPQQHHAETLRGNPTWKPYVGYAPRDISDHWSRLRRRMAAASWVSSHGPHIAHPSASGAAWAASSSRKIGSSRRSLSSSLLAAHATTLAGALSVFVRPIRAHSGVD